MFPPAEDSSSCFGSIYVNNLVQGRIDGVAVLRNAPCFVLRLNKYITFHFGTIKDAALGGAVALIS